MSQKSQVSLFVIIGIIVVVIVTTFYVLVSNNGGSLFGPPNDIAPIVIYTESCIEQVAEDGLLLMSMQGGYLEIPEYLEAKGGYVDNGFQIPYWFHEGRNFKPSMVRMENELADYIDENMMTCLALYVPFASTHDITFEDFPESEVEITDKKVTIKTHYPLTIKKIGTEKVYDWDEFRTEKKTFFGKMYNLASELHDYETENAFLEDYTDEMIAASDYLPFEGLEIDCRPKFYFEPDLKEYTKTLLMHNMNFFQFLGTDYHEIDVPYYDKLYKIDFTNNNYKDINARVMYNSEWDMDFKALPSSGKIIKPHEFKPFNYLNTCLKVWHVRYNLDFPVLFQLTYPEFNEAFYFATPVMMRHNEPNRYNEVAPWETEIEDEDANSRYCMNYTDTYRYSLGPDGFMYSNSMSENNRQNILRVYAVDGLFGYPNGVLKGVNISYQCVRFRCPIGQTGFDETFDGLVITDALPKLKTGFPECGNGILIAEKEGYHLATKHQSVTPETNGEQVTIEMFRLMPYDFSVRVVEEHNGIVNDREPRDNESFLISIKNEDMLFESTLVYPAEKNMFNNLTLLLGNFNYDVEILMTKDKTLVGGAEMTWGPSLEKMINKRHIIFYVYKKDPVYAITSTDELYDLYQQALEESKSYPPIFA